MPEVSIVIPIYNMEQYLKDCVQSVKEQDFKDYEIILVDDGSTDESYKIAAKIAEKDSNIHLIHKRNEGVSVARNVGIDNANGKWIMFVDPDDTLEPPLLGKLHSIADDNVDIVSCCCNAVSDDKNEIDYFFPTDKTINTFEQKKDLYKQLLDAHYGQPGIVHTAIGVPWGKLYRKEFLNENYLRFNIRLKRYQDNIFNMYAFAYARSVKYLNQPLYNYRLEHIKNHTLKYKPGYTDYMSALCEERFICMKKLELFKDEELKEFYCREVFNHLWNIMKNGIFIPENHSSNKKKLEQAKIICQKSWFKPLFLGSSKIFAKKNKVKYWLLKYKQYEIIGMILSLKS